MFEIRNKTELWYKSQEMRDWIHYGKTITIQPTEIKNVFQVMKFNLENEKYEVATDITTIEYLGEKYAVLNGIFEVKETLETPMVSQMELMQAEMLLNQQDIIIKQSEHDEVLAAILLGQQTV